MCKNHAAYCKKKNHHSPIKPINSPNLYLHEAYFNIVLLTENETKNHKTMNSIIKSTAITAILVILFSINTMAVVNFENETYIDDIPFDTEAIFNEVIMERNLIEFDFDDEKYINDIPFDTEVIADKKLYELAFNKEFAIEEEAYIDDIPFYTKEVCVNLEKEYEPKPVTCNYNKTNNSNLSEDVIEIKYLEQNSYALISY